MELLERFAKGDLDAFEALFREYQRDVYGWIVRLVRDPAAAEDLTVETFWRIYRSHARFDAEREFGGWAHRVATNLALTHLRRTRAEAVRLDRLEPRTAVPPDREEGIDVRNATRIAFGELPPKLRAVATLVLLEGKSQAEAAAELGLSASAVKSREFRAVRLLRERLIALGVTHEHVGA
jgi:RNA polymerase sigma-70 factor (ECF subfamily)